MKRLYVKILLALFFFAALALAGAVVFRVTGQQKWLEEDLRRQGRILFSTVMDRQREFWREQLVIGRHNARIFAAALAQPLPDAGLAFTESNGSRRLQIGEGDESLGLYLARPDTPEQEPRLLAGQPAELLRFSRSLSRQATCFFFVSPGNWLAVLPARWAMAIEDNHDLTLDPGYASATPERDPQRQPRFSGYYYDDIWKSWLITISLPVYAGGRFVGVAGHSVSSAQLLAATGLEKPRSNGQLFATDAGWNVILHPQLKAVYENTRFTPGQRFEYNPALADPVARAVADAARQQPFDARIFDLPQGRMLALCQRERLSGWYYFFVIRASDIPLVSRHLADTNLLVNAAGLLLLAFLTFLFMKSALLTPLRAMGKSLETYKTTGTGQVAVLGHRRSREFDSLYRDIEEAFRRIDEKAGEARQAREQIETLMRTAQFIVVVLDRELNLTYINDYGLKKLGIRADDVHGHRVSEFMMRDFLKEAAATLEQQKEILDHETHLSLPSGEKLDVTISLAKTFDDAERHVGYMAVVADVTQRKRAETDLRNQIIFSQQIFTSIPEMILIADTQLRVTFLNKQARDRLRSTEEGPIGQPLAHLLSKRSIESGFDETVRNVIEHGQGINQINTANPFAEEESFVDLLVEPLQSGGRRIGAIILLRDISEWRRLTSQLRALQGFMQKLINASPFAIISINSDHLITTWNLSAEKMLGVTFETAFGKSLFQLLPAFTAYRDTIHEAIILRKTSFLNDEKLMIGDERFIVANLTFYPVTAEQNGAVIHIEDLSELKKLESSLLQAQKMESLGVLASSMIHDFNNVLSGILGYASLLDKKVGEDPKLKKYVSTIISSSERASSLIGQVLNFSRKKLSEKEIVNINDLIRESLDFIAFNLRTVKVEVQLTPEKALLSADKTKVSQTLINLLLNAKDALEKTSQPRIRIRTELVAIHDHPHLLDGRYVLISIADNGCGIAQEHLEKVFEPFFTTKGKGKGTGLGLAMVREIIRDYNGHIAVESETGAGTAFSIYLPLFNQEALQPLPEIGDAEDLGAMDGTVLLVDDEEVVREIGADMLKTLGLNCLTAADGSQGVDIYLQNQGRIGLVILDIEMPGLSGDKVAARLREIDPQVSILIASGYTREYLESNVFHASIEHFIPKPFKIEQLSYQVRKLLKPRHV